ncbi:MAG: hypothetical protein ACP5TY_07465, partial [Thermodesulforhabdaceae bacterium]
FFADLEGHQEDEPVKKALADMELTVSILKILGSYPKASVEEPVRIHGEMVRSEGVNNDTSSSGTAFWRYRLSGGT